MKMTWRNRLRLNLPLLPIEGGADGTIAIDEPTTIDKYLDTESLTVGATTVQRERVQIAGAAATDLAPVTAANGLDVDVTRLPALVAGTANIGDVDVLTIAAGDNNIGNVDIVTLPASTNTLEVVGDAAHDAAVAGNPLLLGGTSSAAAPTDVSADAEVVRLWALRNGALAINVTAAGALIAGDATNGLDIDVTRLPALVAGTANIGDVDVLTVPAPLSTTGGGTEATALRVTVASDSTGVLSVDDNGAALTVDNGGTFAVQATAVGTIADDATTPGAPVMVGGFAISPDGTDPGSVSAEADVARFRTDLNRRILNNNVHPNHWSYHLNTSTAQTDTAVAADPGDGFQLAVTDIVFSSGAGTAINLFFEEGASTILGPYYLEAVAGRGMALHFVTPKFITASTALTLTTSASIAHSVDVTGFIQAV